MNTKERISRVGISLAVALCLLVVMAGTVLAEDGSKLSTTFDVTCVKSCDEKNLAEENGSPVAITYTPIVLGKTGMTMMADDQWARDLCRLGVIAYSEKMDLFLADEAMVRALCDGGIEGLSQYLKAMGFRGLPESGIGGVGFGVPGGNIYVPGIGDTSSSKLTDMLGIDWGRDPVGSFLSLVTQTARLSQYETVDSGGKGARSEETSADTTTANTDENAASGSCTGDSSEFKCSYEGTTENGESWRAYSYGETSSDGNTVTTVTRLYKDGKLVGEQETTVKNNGSGGLSVGIKGYVVTDGKRDDYEYYFAVGDRTCGEPDPVSPWELPATLREAFKFVPPDVGCFREDSPVLVWFPNATNEVIDYGPAGGPTSTPCTFDQAAVIIGVVDPEPPTNT